MTYTRKKLSRKGKMLILKIVSNIELGALLNRPCTEGFLKGQIRALCVVRIEISKLITKITGSLSKFYGYVQLVIKENIVSMGHNKILPHRKICAVKRRVVHQPIEHVDIWPSILRLTKRK